MPTSPARRKVLRSKSDSRTHQILPSTALRSSQAPILDHEKACKHVGLASISSGSGTMESKRKRLAEGDNLNDRTKSPKLVSFQATEKEIEPRSGTRSLEEDLHTFLLSVLFVNFVHIDAVLLQVLLLAVLSTFVAKLQPRRDHGYTDQNYRHIAQQSETATTSTRWLVLTEHSKDEDIFKLLQWIAKPIEEQVDPDDPVMLNAACTQALLLTQLGKHEDAEFIFRKCLRLRNKSLMWDDPDTQAALGLLDASLRTQGKVDEATHLARTYCLPAMIKAVMLEVFPLKLTYLHVGLVDNHYEDRDIQGVLDDHYFSTGGIRLRPQDGSLAVELLPDPGDLRVVIVVSRHALMGDGPGLEKAIRHSLGRAVGDWRELGIDTFVCFICYDEGGNTWALLPHRRV